METRTPRQGQIAAIKKKDPNKRQVDIARELGISRQRVHQVIKDLGYPPVVILDIPSYCANCGKNLSKQTKGDLCWDCHLADLHNRSLVKLTCPQCGRVFTKRRGYVSSQRKRGYRQFFCGGSCRSKSVIEAQMTECAICGRKFRTKGIAFLEVDFGICEKCLEEIEKQK